MGAALGPEWTTPPGSAGRPSADLTSSGHRLHWKHFSSVYGFVISRAVMGNLGSRGLRAASQASDLHTFSPGTRTHTDCPQQIRVSPAFLCVAGPTPPRLGPGLSHTEPLHTPHVWVPCLQTCPEATPRPLPLICIHCDLLWPLPNLPAQPTLRCERKGQCGRSQKWT